MTKIKSIAVLPFKNMSSNAENEHFCDGITEEIINALAKINELKVTSRTSSFHFKDKELPIVEIAKTLNVAVILEGSVRLSGETIRITAQLIQAEDDFHFWSETWDRKLENIFEIQDEISLLIADKIRENFGHFELQDHLVKKQTEDINVYECSLLASFHKNKWNADDVKIAEELYLKAIEADENHVESIVGLSDTYSFMAMTGMMSFEEAWVKSNELVNRAMKIDPKNPEIYYQKANGSFFTECDFDQALKYAYQAIQLKPNYVEAQQFISFLYVVSGKSDAAKKHLDIALGIDPLSQETLFFKAYFDYMTENYPASLVQLNDCLEVNPKNIPAHAVKCLCLLKMGQFDEVIYYYDDTTVQMVEGDKLGTMGLAYALKGDKENTKKYLRILQEQAGSPDGFTQDSFVFMMHVAMRNIESAFEWISAGIETKASLLLLRYSDPIINALKSDPRYDQFYKILFPFASKVQKSKKKELLDSETAQQIKTKLLELVDNDQPYLDSSLSLRSLAKQLEIHPNQLSWLLNETVGKSFNEFINGYRVAAFKRLAKESKSSNLTLLGMAYDCGFNSKTVFHTYFKKETGLTPSQFVKELS